MNFDEFRATPTDKVFDTFPELYQLYSETIAIIGAGKKNSSPHPGLTAEQIISLIVYSYHQESNVVKQHASMHLRRKEALKILSFVLETSEDLIKQEKILQYVVGSNNFANHLAIQFCKFEKNSSKWYELCRKQDILDDVGLVLKGEQEGTEKKSATELLSIKIKLEQQAEGLQLRINQLATEIFAGDSALTPLAAAHDIIERRKPILVPERQAEKQKLRSK